VFALAVALSAPVISDANLLLTMFTPAVEVVIVLGFLAPEGGFRAALAGLGLDRAGYMGWPIAIGTPALIHRLGVALMVLVGLPAVAVPAATAPVALVLLKVATGLFAQTLFSLAEEWAGGTTCWRAWAASGSCPRCWWLACCMRSGTCR
jgi:hypothetical protein